MAGSLSSANREIREAEEREQARKLARLKRPRRLTAQLLAELEELNLDDVDQVPTRLGPRLYELLESLQPWPQAERQYGLRLRPGVRTSEMIDTIFGIEEILSPSRKEPTAAADRLLLLDSD